MAKNKVIIDDGCNPELVGTAFFDGILEMPRLLRLEKFVIPKGIVPFSKRNRSEACQDFIGFYEPDVSFGDFLRRPQEYIEEIRKYPGMVSIDSSLYCDMPLTAQIINTYRNRASCYYCQKNGLYTVPNIRWGDERSYTTEFLPEKFPFLGVPKHSMVSIGSYGCISGAENKQHFRQGLEAMLDELLPEIVLVYGSMPDSVFAPFLHRTRFIPYSDWTARMRRRAG